jgi:hypothetical protein
LTERVSRFALPTRSVESRLLGGGVITVTERSMSLRRGMPGSCADVFCGRQGDAIMKCRLTGLLLSLFAMLYPLSALGAAHVYLDANFNDKAIDAPIGAGGASVGEPTEVDNTIFAVVRDGPMGSPSLEIQDNHLWAGGASFQLLGQAEVTTGILDIAADLWFDTLADGANCAIKICEQGTFQSRFSDLAFFANGSVELTYGESSSAGIIGQFVAGRVFRVILEFDMDAGTVDVWLDGVKVVDDLVHGVTDRGIGGVRFCALFDEDFNGHFYVDNIKVTDYFEAVPTEDTSWGRVRTQFR